MAFTCDGASSSRTFRTMHFHMTDDDVNLDVSVTYRTINLYDLEERFIYFIYDGSHLIKASRNCLSDSGSTYSSNMSNI